MAKELSWGKTLQKFKRKEMHQETYCRPYSEGRGRRGRCNDNDGGS